MRKPTGKSGASRGPRGSSGAGLFIVPRLEELVADPGQVNVLDIDTARILRTRAISALNLLHGYDVEHASMIVGGYAQPRDRLLNVKQAAEKLGVKVGWLYRRHKDFRFTVRHGRLLRFSELGIEEDIRRRSG